MINLKHFIKALIFIIALIPLNLIAQEFKGGKVVYQERTVHDYEKQFANRPEMSERSKDWIARLPAESTKQKLLVFSKELAVFMDNPHSGDIMDEGKGRGKRYAKMMENRPFFNLTS